MELHARPVESCMRGRVTLNTSLCYCWIVVHAFLQRFLSHIEYFQIQQQSLARQQCNITSDLASWSLWGLYATERSAIALLGGKSAGAAASAAAEQHPGLRRVGAKHAPLWRTRPTAAELAAASAASASAASCWRNVHGLRPTTPGWRQQPACASRAERQGGSWQQRGPWLSRRPQAPQRPPPTSEGSLEPCTRRRPGAC
jgi:hypothetical protein